MSIKDIRLLEAITQLHNAARLVTNDLGENKLGDDIRKCADRLNDLVKAELHTEK